MFWLDFLLIFDFRFNEFDNHYAKNFPQRKRLESLKFLMANLHEIQSN